VELNELNVNNVLNEIRPYIEADGGYLEFVAIDYLKEGAVVIVKLLGACSTCAMSSMTLKQGIESHLQAQWPEIIEVMQC
jgi:Fe-S cluster biogenesis protein NfuA